MPSSAGRPPFLPLIRLLAEAYQAFEQLSTRHVRELGLTPSQFDVIVTLGNTDGMSCKTLGARTLITKGTLTGILDRLVDKGLLQRESSASDKRSVFVSLTPAGAALFARIFPQHLDYMSQFFSDFSARDYAQCQQGLQRLCSALQPATSNQEEHHATE